MLNLQDAGGEALTVQNAIRVSAWRSLGHRIGCLTLVCFGAGRRAGSCAQAALMHQPFLADRCGAGKATLAKINVLGRAFGEGWANRPSPLYPQGGGGANPKGTVYPQGIPTLSPLCSGEGGARSNREQLENGALSADLTLDRSHQGPTRLRSFIKESARWRRASIFGTLLVLV